MALLLLVTTSLWRRRLIRRYETWRGAHVVLAVTVLVLTGLHVLWLRHLIVQPRFRWWFATLAFVVVAASLRRWVWRPFRAWQRPWVVGDVRHESPTVSTLVLRVVELLNDPHEGWTGGIGYLTADVLSDHLPASREQLDYFLCGSPQMVTGVVAALRTIGVAPHHIHTEKFDFV